MEYISLDTIVAILGLFIGGGGGAFFTWRWQRRRAKAEAKTAEADAAKEWQDVYQQLIEDIKTDRDEQKQYIAELKDDRQHLRRDRDDLRKRQDELEEAVRSLQRDVDRTNRLVEQMRPLLCGLAGECPNRKPVAPADLGITKPRTKAKPQSIEPIDSDAL
jgi:HAMP domain-containing protein